MNNSIRKCGPTFFIPWDTVDSMFSLWTKQYFGDQVIRMHLDYDLHDNSYSFCINLKYNNICRTKLREFLNRHDPFSRMELTADCPTLVFDDNEANWILEEALQPDIPGIRIETYLARENGIYIICDQGRRAT